MRSKAKPGQKPLFRAICAAALLIGIAGLALASGMRPIVLDPSYNHDRFNTQPKDVIRMFRAFTVSFDGPDDDDRDGQPDMWGIPEWVAYEIRAFDSPLGNPPARPGTWMTDPELFEEGIAPSDDSYRFSNAFRREHPKDPQLGYDRGHMCMKLIAFRMGADADWNSHTLLNACPQRSVLNQGIWLDLERQTIHWAEEFRDVWIICGPIVEHRHPTRWLGEPGERPVAIPDAFFKIVVRIEGSDKRPVVLAFIYPQEDARYSKRGPYPQEAFLVSVDEIEARTGLNFLTSLPDTLEEQVESVKAHQLWK